MSLIYFRLFINNIRRISISLWMPQKVYSCSGITSRVDYCNNLLYGLPYFHLSKLQRVPNAYFYMLLQYSSMWLVGSAILRLSCVNFTGFQYDHVLTSCKIILITFKAIRGNAAAYIKDLLLIKLSSYNLRSTK